MSENAVQVRRTKSDGSAIAVAPESIGGGNGANGSSGPRSPVADGKTCEHESELQGFAKTIPKEHRTRTTEPSTVHYVNSSREALRRTRTQPQAHEDCSDVHFTTLVFTQRA